MKVCQNCGLRFYLHIEKGGNSISRCNKCPICCGNVKEVKEEGENKNCEVCKTRKSIDYVMVSLSVCDECLYKMYDKQEVFEKRIKDVVEETLIVEEI